MAPRSIFLKKKKHMKKVAYEGSTCQVTGPKERVRPYYKSVLIDAGSLRQKNSRHDVHIIKCLLTELGGSGRENIWLSVRTHGPLAKYFPVRPSHSGNEYIHFPIFALRLGIAFVYFIYLFIYFYLPHNNRNYK